MCCLFLTLGLLGPRFAFLGTWIFTGRVQHAFSGGFLWPLFGLLFLPWTALVYVFAWSPLTGVSSLGWFVVFLGFIVDMATYSSRSAQRGYYSRQAA